MDAPYYAPSVYPKSGIPVLFWIQRRRASTATEVIKVEKHS